MGLDLDDFAAAAGESIPGYCGDLPGETGALLLQAAACRDDTRTELLLLKAHSQSPCHFAVYLALYKFYFYRQRFEETEQWMRAGLAASAQAADFPLDAPPAAVFAEPLAPAPRFYLFSLKALAFALLRQHRPEEARAYIGQLERLDPEDRIGAGLVQAMAEAAQD